MFNIVNLAENLATQAHNGQFRRDGVTPYIEHPKAVAEYLAIKGFGEEYIAAAWLHDVLEDTETTAEDLKNAGIPSPVIEAVKLLSKTKDTDINLYYEAINKNSIAKEVKIADMKHNLSCNSTKKAQARYQLGFRIFGCE
jgi:(p)ppGpp synthase/HD superfamily hydrolase